MGLSRNTVRVLVALMTLAIGGVLYLQYRLLANNVELKEASFGHNVMAALDEVSSRLEEVDIRNRIFASTGDSNLPVMLHMKKRSGGGLPPGADTMVFISVVTSEDGPLSARINGNRLTFHTALAQKLTVRVYDELGGLDTTILDSKLEPGTHELDLPGDTSGPAARFVRIQGEHATSTIRWERGEGFRYKVTTNDDARATKIAGRVAESVAPGDVPPLAVRARPGLVDSVLSRVLPGNGIDLDYEYAVRDLDADSVVVSKMGEGATVPGSAYSTMLFPAGFNESHGQLLLWFPGYRTHLFRSILPELFLNLFFVLVIGACFRYALRTLRKQREFAGRLTDFINNMTHEFKTPLSTIALSTEALARPDVIGDRSKIEMYGGIIGEEHRRMRSQVDRILELAALEEGEFEFRRERIDINEVVAKAAANSGLRVSDRDGTVSTDLRAAEHYVRGDAVHLANVVNSVLDNAEKYSPGPPAIRVATYNADGCVVVSVADRGIGIAAEHLPDVFEKYFRVPTNNLHDVKGFGIGLSYVKLVVGRHGGSVRAESSKSSPGHGTTIEIKIPVDRGR